MERNKCTSALAHAEIEISGKRTSSDLVNRTFLREKRDQYVGEEFCTRTGTESISPGASEKLHACSQVCEEFNIIHIQHSSPGFVQTFGAWNQSDKKEPAGEFEWANKIANRKKNLFVL